MTESLETMECRRNHLENQMFELAGELSEQLHEIEQVVSDLASRLHTTVCESGRAPIEVKSLSVLDAVDEAEAKVRVDGMAEKAARVAELKAEISVYERRITEEMQARIQERQLASTGGR